jgi:hypothetical protein
MQYVVTVGFNKTIWENAIGENYCCSSMMSVSNFRNRYNLARGVTLSCEAVSVDCGHEILAQSWEWG